MTQQSEGAKTIIRPSEVPYAEDGLHSISFLSEKFGVTLRAIRFYCERNLIRAVTGYGHIRFFDRFNAEKLSLIQQAKALGFTLTEIKLLIVDQLEGMPGPVLVLRDDQIEEQIAMIERHQATRLEQLKSLIAKGSKDEAVPQQTLLRRSA